MCKKGTESLGREVEKWHMVIVPLTVHLKNQYNWLNGKSTRSNKYLFMSALSKAGIRIEDTEDLVDRTFLFRDVVTSVNKETNQTYGVWVVDKELSKAEVADMVGFKKPDNVRV